MATADIDTTVIGAGVVGLAIARSLAAAGRQVLILERNNAFGAETSSRNSEVIHAGLYYPAGSLRARLCVDGRHALYRFCADNGVAHARCGKLLVATSEDQLPKLAGIETAALANGVDDLKRLTATEAKALEPEVACVAAVLSPSTGIVDSHGLMIALLGHAEANGAELVLNTSVTAIRTQGGVYRVDTADGATFTSERIVVAAGLGATTLARTIPFTTGYRPPETYFAKGQYYALSGRSPFRRHVYPMPQGAWLGLHATVDLGGRAKFGPDIEWTPAVDYSFRPEKLAQFLDFIRSYYPGLDESRLHPDYTGVRPKLYREGEPVPDFAIHGPQTHGMSGLVVLFGIESPGLTASLAIADDVARLLDPRD
jgi:L-2-hydroxyglutarate oxidase LhgO